MSLVCLIVVAVVVFVVIFVVMVLVVVLASLQIEEISLAWNLFVAWHHILDESHANVISQRILNLSIGNFLAG